MRIFKKFTIVILFFACFMMSSCHQQQPDARDSQGQAINMKNYLGKWVVINYWATWCKPCLKEMPALNRLYKNHNKQVVVLGVSFDQLSNRKINKIAKNLKLNYPLLSQFPIKRYHKTPITVLPISFIINREGHLTKILNGPRTEKQFMKILNVQ